MIATIQVWENHERTGRIETVPLRMTPAPHKGATRTGYGSALPTPYEVFFRSRWRRVKCACFASAACMYVGRRGAWEAVVRDIDRQAT